MMKENYPYITHFCELSHKNEQILELLRNIYGNFIEIRMLIGKEIAESHHWKLFTFVSCHIVKPVTKLPKQ